VREHGLKDEGLELLLGRAGRLCGGEISFDR
jgi:hypothetical protein